MTVDTEGYETFEDVNIGPSVESASEEFEILKSWQKLSILKSTTGG